MCPSLTRGLTYRVVSNSWSGARYQIISEPGSARWPRVAVPMVGRVEQAVSRAAAIFEEAIPTGHRGWFDDYLIRSWLDIVGAYDETLDYLPPTDFGWRIADDAHLRQLATCSGSGRRWCERGRRL